MCVLCRHDWREHMHDGDEKSERAKQCIAGEQVPLNLRLILFHERVAACMRTVNTEQQLTFEFSSRRHSERGSEGVRKTKNRMYARCANAIKSLAVRTSPNYHDIMLVDVCNTKKNSFLPFRGKKNANKRVIKHQKFTQNVTICLKGVVEGRKCACDMQ